MITALAIASILTLAFFIGLAIARRAKKRWARVTIRVGAVIFTILLFGIIPGLFEADLMTIELAGRYLFYLMIGAALLYKFFLVRFIPLPEKDTET